MKIYNTTRGQLITILVFGLLFWVGDLFVLADSYEPSGVSKFLALFVPAFLIFYVIGWRKYNNKKLFKINLKNRFEKLKESKKEKSTKPQKELKGVDGWLWFFVATLYIGFIVVLISGFADVYELFTSFETLGKNVIGLVLPWIIYYLGFLILLVYTVRSLVKIKPNAVLLAKLCLILFFILGLFDVIYYYLFEEISIIEDSELGRNLVYSIIWFLYLTFSTRVKNTYPPKNRKIKKIDRLLFSIILISFSIGYAVVITMSPYLQSATPTIAPSENQQKIDFFKPLMGSKDDETGNVIKIKPDVKKQTPQPVVPSVEPPVVKPPALAPPPSLPPACQGNLNDLKIIQFHYSVHSSLGKNPDLKLYGLIKNSSTCSAVNVKLKIVIQDSTNPNIRQEETETTFYQYSFPNLDYLNKEIGPQQTEQYSFYITPFDTFMQKQYLYGYVTGGTFSTNATVTAYIISAEWLTPSQN